ncbi:ABC transporter ATP-binding protein [Dietzia maris]|jgi:ABC-2 type transport system ATP-binding protein|uniref:ABC transporter ATP-binding protein n=1 Tax=Dietzia TaxID=37914 RepID=UPI0009F54FE7|nr:MULTISPECIES: ABC transporter ATP-binding protein [Dietzia]MBB0994084.1 ABC transporter ATP-binding protein [Dietzia sp. SLG510A3-40A3]MCY1657866.1 ABC transporter ATP-binding protein [Dietzia sp. SL131]MCZ4539455.1 ABC transporter ATP-binding protein [Dietzia maris]MCZ4656080.1 ABC transporter ATP-binding protein [Dietzia kunjamensis]MDJ0422675.1 ABC transporter ATP-binding protein [Dietzia kunjamensis]
MVIHRSTRPRDPGRVGAVIDTDAPAPALEFHDLTQTFTRPRAETVHALRGIDLRIDPGEVVALLGPNGAGKTTALDIALGLTEPTGGRARAFGAVPRQAVADGRIAAVLQTGGLLSDLTVEETVRAIAALYRDPLSVGEVLDRAGIATIGRRKVSRCSGGEQQRLRFALALLPDPDLLILDEPTAAMDVGTRREFWSTMHAEATSGSTVLFATHHLEEAEAFADRIVLMARGRIVADGPVEAIRAMATGTRVTAVWTPGPGEPAPHDLPGVTAVERTPTRVILTSTDSDATAGALLRGTAARDLTISPRSLDDAFVALTAAPDTTAPDTTDPDTTDPDQEAAR